MLPFRDETFDVVYQSTVISSVLDATRRVAILREAGRVLRSGGVLISYDTRYPNPWNRHTRPLPTAELRNALPGWNLSAISLTGIPQIIRPLSRISLSLCRMVEAVPVLRSHLLVSARKP
jgi:ubiquinone/menaquinone biosynthesis C-methylase UbiE